MNQQSGNNLLPIVLVAGAAYFIAGGGGLEGCKPIVGPVDPVAPIGERTEIPAPRAELKPHADALVVKLATNKVKAIALEEFYRGANRILEADGGQVINSTSAFSKAHRDALLAFTAAEKIPEPPVSAEIETILSVAMGLQPGDPIPSKPIDASARRQLLEGLKAIAWAAQQAQKGTQ